MFESNALTRARSEVAHLRSRAAEGVIPPASQEWGGANVVIATSTQGGRCREIVTPHALEVSWVFERLRDAFGDLVDSCTKFELYGRLELAANAAIDSSPEIGSAGICAAVLDEADVILDEMSGGKFEYLAVALGVGIARDFAGRRA